jgi:oligosaccharide repeat unit polymerase
LTLSIYILLGLLIASLELRRRVRGLPIDAMTVFNCYYLVLYVLVPINVLCVGEDVVRAKYAYETFGEGDAYTALSLLCSYVLFCFGYGLKSSTRPKLARRGERNYYSLANSAYVAKIIFLVGALLTVIYVVQIGGVSEVITMASQVRSGEYHIESKYIFYRFFSQFSADAFVLFFAVLIGKKVIGIAITARDKVFLFCAFVFFVYYAASTGGRRPFIYPVILCYLVAASVGMRAKKWAVVGLALIFVFAGLGSLISVMGSVDNLPGLVELTSSNENASWPALFVLGYDNASQGLSDSFVSYVASQKASLWQFGFLTDIGDLPRDFFPSQIFGFTRTRNNMLGQTSEYMLGHPLPEDVSGEVTLGLPGYLLVNFGYIGMFALFFLLGRFYKWIHIRFKPAELKDAVGWLVYWWVVLAFFVYFRDGVLVFVVKMQITWWITIALLRYLQANQTVVLSSSSAMEGSGSIRTV